MDLFQIKRAVHSATNVPDTRDSESYIIPTAKANSIAAQGISNQVHMNIPDHLFTGTNSFNYVAFFHVHEGRHNHDDGGPRASRSDPLFSRSTQATILINYRHCRPSQGNAIMSTSTNTRDRPCRCPVGRNFYRVYEFRATVPSSVDYTCSYGEMSKWMQR
ncbi:hypothetical protein BD410DRAFT_203566 [Rickenella mellea]|uniref:Uncharacterized protein n=1 Tax=Rickenella mellea TaxID=50990 RepID=A0A4Y7PG83_9AGAM|nr:hypothetical protein BD410DRAFT_203566 [Rickenella mellea]